MSDAFCDTGASVSCFSAKVLVRLPPKETVTFGTVFQKTFSRQPGQD